MVKLINSYFFIYLLMLVTTFQLFANNALTVEPSPTIIKININDASSKELTELPGIGQVKAQRIVQLREEIGGFHHVEQLMEVKGIGSRLFDRIKDLITL